MIFVKFGGKNLNQKERPYFLSLSMNHRFQILILSHRSNKPHKRAYLFVLYLWELENYFLKFLEILGSSSGDIIISAFKKVDKIAIMP